MKQHEPTEMTGAHHGHLAGHGADPRQSLAGGSTIPQVEPEGKQHKTVTRIGELELSARWNPATNWTWTVRWT